MDIIEHVVSVDFGDFGTALVNLKKGHRVARHGWNGQNMWLVMVNPPDYSVEAYCLFNSKELSPWIGIKTANDMFVPWLANHTDMLANDWKVLG